MLIATVWLALILGLSTRIAELGYTVVYGSREPDREDVAALVSRTGGNASARLSAKAIPDADIVVLAVPWTAVEGIVGSVEDSSMLFMLNFSHGTIADTSHELHRRKNDNYKNAIAMMPKVSARFALHSSRPIDLE